MPSSNSERASKYDSNENTFAVYMTTRQSLVHQRRLGFALGAPGILLFAVGLEALEPGQTFSAAELVGLALVGVSLLYIMLAGRCLRCRRCLVRPSYRNGVSLFQLAPSDLQFCPYCGESVNNPTKA